MMYRYDRSWGHHFSSFEEFLAFSWPVITVTDAWTGRAHIVTRLTSIGAFLRMIKTRYVYIFASWKGVEFSRSLLFSSIPSQPPQIRRNSPTSSQHPPNHPIRINNPTPSQCYRLRLLQKAALYSSCSSPRRPQGPCPRWGAESNQGCVGEAG
jgi:hypothetical protein